jgi:hypothetical protein
MPRTRISPWKAAVPAAFVVLAVAACQPASSSSSASSSPSSAPAASPSGAQSSALCQDLTELRDTVTSFAELKANATSNSVTTDAQLLATELGNVAQAAQGRFAPQADGLKSALGTLLSDLKGLSNGTVSKSSVKDAAENVEARAVDLAVATKDACPWESPASS